MCHHDVEGGTAARPSARHQPFLAGRTGSSSQASCSLRHSSMVLPRCARERITETRRAATCSPVSVSLTPAREVRGTRDLEARRVSREADAPHAQVVVQPVVEERVKDERADVLLRWRRLLSLQRALPRDASALTSVAPASTGTRACRPSPMAMPCLRSERDSNL